MLTYVINTSENKTFDSDKLFDLAGYNKIRWMNCMLDQVGLCAAEIYEKQNVLGADDFRIAVLVDFYAFDRVRLPYGRQGFHEETGVDISLYMPYIEAYLLDNLKGYLEKKDLHTADFEIYYVQNEKHEPYEFLDNAIEQVRSVLTGVEETAVPVPEEVVEEEDPIRVEALKYMSEEEKAEYEQRLQRRKETEKNAYSVFSLYCTPNLSLNIKLEDYTYGADTMTFSQFFAAFRQRSARKSMIRRHYYITTYGGGPARAAFDTLSLSLYLIRMYEREEQISTEGEFEMIHLDASVLKDVLETAWSKVNLARSVAKSNESEYYALDQGGAIEQGMQRTVELSEEEAIAKERRSLPADVTDVKRVEDMYRTVVRYWDRDDNSFDDKTRKELDDIMKAYLTKRDQTRENNIENELEERRLSGELDMIPQCPSREQYEYLVDKKQKEISELFERTLKADRIDVSFDEEKSKADSAYKRYNKAKACMQKNLIVDIVFAVLTVLSVMVPYIVFQLTDAKLVGALLMGTEMAAASVALLLFAFVLQGVKYKIMMKRAKDDLRRCYLDCCAKHNYSISALRQRYEQDLIHIEEARYDIRQIKHLYELNLAKDKNVMRHREMLAEVEDRLSSMLNNLDVEPVFNPDESVVGEFDLTKSIRSRENKVYQIFSIETIERMFPRKGSDKR